MPRPILWAENLLRAAVFIWPLLLPLSWQNQRSRAGLALYALGILVDFASWLPLIYRPEAAWSRSAAALLAPAYSR